MPYQILSHTADLRMRVTGKTMQELFSDALYGLMHILNEEVSSEPNHRVSAKQFVSLSAPDRTALLVDFLNEALSLAQVGREVYTRVTFEKLTDTELSAELAGVDVEEFDEDVKAATYHEAEVTQNENGEWETMLVFDI